MKLLWFSSFSTSDYDGTIFAGFCIAFHSTCITSSHNLSIKFGLAKISDCEQYFNTQWLKTQIPQSTKFQCRQKYNQRKNQLQAGIFTSHRVSRCIKWPANIFNYPRHLSSNTSNRKPVVFSKPFTKHQHHQYISTNLCITPQVVFSQESKFTAKWHWPEPCIMNQDKSPRQKLFRKLSVGTQAGHLPVHNTQENWKYLPSCLKLVHRNFLV